MRKQNGDNPVSTYEALMKNVAERVREFNRPKLIGESPSEDVERTGYIFTQTIRSDAERCGIPSHLLKHVLITFHGSPDIPKPKGMSQILEAAKSYIREAEATYEAAEITLLADEGGKIVLRKSKAFPYGFNFRFIFLHHGG